MFLSRYSKCKKINNFHISQILVYYYLLTFYILKNINIFICIGPTFLSLKNKKIQQAQICCIYISTNLILFTYFIEFKSHNVTEEACLAANSRNSSYIFLFEEFDVSSDIDLIIANGTFNSWAH